MTTRDETPDAVDALDRYLDRLARGDDRTPADLDPVLAAAARALRSHDRPPVPDPAFVARLREDLTMDQPQLSLRSADTGTSVPIAGPAARPVGAAQHQPPLPASGPPAGSRRRALVRGWNGRAWPVLEFLGAAALILGLITVMTGGQFGGLPALLPGAGDDRGSTSVAVDPDGPVAMSQGDAGRTGVMPGPGVPGNPALLWKIPVDVPSGESPFGSLGGDSFVVAANGAMVYLERSGTSGSDGARPAWDSTLHVADAGTGQDRWRVTFSGLSQGAPLVAAGLVIVTVDPPDGQLLLPGDEPLPAADPDRGYVLAFDLVTGVERWRAGVGLVGYQDPVYADGLVYVVDQSGYGHGLDVTTGESRWQTPNVPPLGSVGSSVFYIPAFSSVTVADDLVLFSTAAGSTYAFARDDGEFVWTWPDPVEGGSTRTLADPPAPVVSGSTVFLSGSEQDGMSAVVAVDLQTGVQRWVERIGSYGPVQVAVQDGFVVVVANRTVVQAIDAETGSRIGWQQEFEEFVSQPPTIADGVVYVGAEDGSVLALDLATGVTIWSVRTAGRLASPVYVADGFAWFVSADGNLYAIGDSTRTGTPAPGGAALDVSGLPPCAVEPLPPLNATPIPNDATSPPLADLAGGTPAATFPDPDEDPAVQQIYPPVIAWDAIPTGSAPTAEQARGISLTLTRMLACDRPGNDANLATFFTEDYFLRPWVVWQMDCNDVYPVWHPTASERDIQSVTIAARVLDDGRIGLLMPSDYLSGSGQLIVFAEVEGEWLIDEMIDVTPSGRPALG